jgi:hypothetical protein
MTLPDTLSLDKMRYVDENKGNGGCGVGSFMKIVSAEPGPDNPIYILPCN